MDCSVFPTIGGLFHSNNRHRIERFVNFTSEPYSSDTALLKKNTIFITSFVTSFFLGYCGRWLVHEKRIFDSTLSPTIKQLESKPPTISDPVCIIAIGQSNVANHGFPIGRGVSNSYAFSVNGWFELVDPVVGGSGNGGSVWTRVAPLVIDRQLGDSFIVASVAQGSSSSEDWAPSGSHYPKLQSVINSLKSESLDVDAVIYHQGETEAWSNNTNGGDYQSHLQLLIEKMRVELPETPIVICITSRDSNGRVNPAVRLAQKRVIDANERVLQGPDTDTLGDDCRCDGVHFNEKGFERFALELVKVLGEIIRQSEEDFIRD